MDDVCPYDRDATVDKIVKARVPKLNDNDRHCGNGVSAPGRVYRIRVTTKKPIAGIAMKMRMLRSRRGEDT